MTTRGNRSPRGSFSQRPRSQSDLETYAEKILNSDNGLRANERAHLVERELERRRSSDKNFYSSRPLSLSEAQTLRSEEQRRRHEARLHQVREKEAILAKERLQSFADTRRLASEKAARALQNDSKHWRDERRALDYVPSPPVRKSRNTEFAPVSQRRSEERPNSSERHRYESQVRQRSQYPPEGQRPRSTSTDVIKPLRDLYAELEHHQREWLKFREKLDHDLMFSSSASSSYRSPLVGPTAPTSNNIEGPGRKVTKEKPRERNQQESNAEGPSNLRKSRQDVRASDDLIHFKRMDEITDLHENDVIYLRDDGIEAVGEEFDGDRLASSTWFAMAEAEMPSDYDFESSDEVPSHSRIQSSEEVPSHSRIEHREARTASRLPLEVELASSRLAKPRISAKEEENVILRRSRQLGEPRPSLIDRLESGRREIIHRDEMFLRTEQAYVRLPEVADRRKDRLKRDEAERRRLLVKELDERQRRWLLRGRRTTNSLYAYE